MRPHKAATNERRHGVLLRFYDERALLIDDPDHSGEEDRFVLLGFSNKLRVLVVVHAYRANDEVIRLISARRATKRERERYDER